MYGRIFEIDHNRRSDARLGDIVRSGDVPRRTAVFKSAPRLASTSRISVPSLSSSDKYCNLGISREPRA